MEAWRPLKAIRLTRLALQDLAEIRTYTRGQFGAEQERRYLEALRRHFEQLRDLPGEGRLYPTSTTLRVSIFRPHRIFYEATGAGIAIKRVVHAARNLDLLLGDSPE